MYALRGTEVPSLFSVWVAVFLLASMVKREAWLEWYPMNMYPNLYLVLLSNPGLGKKTTAIVFGDKVLKASMKLIGDPNVLNMKKLKLIRNKATPEKLIADMLPKGAKQPLVGPDGAPIINSKGKAVFYYPTSEVTIMAPELATMLGRQSYNDGMVELLLDLFDPHDTWEFRTKGEGIKTLKKVCTSFLGGSTPEGIKNSVSTVAAGDGFLSRTIIAHLPYSFRVRPHAHKPKLAPDIPEMAARLAWVAENSMGAFTLSKKANFFYEAWYHKHKRRLIEHQELAGIEGRADINLLKVALLMRLQRYKGTREISLEDIEESQRLLAYTSRGIPDVINGILGSENYQLFSSLERYIQSHPGVTRGVLLRNKHIPANTLTPILQEMRNRGQITVTKGGQQVRSVSSNSEETYTWVTYQDEEDSR